MIHTAFTPNNPPGLVRRPNPFFETINYRNSELLQLPSRILKIIVTSLEETRDVLNFKAACKRTDELVTNFFPFFSIFCNIRNTNVEISEIQRKIHKSPSSKILTAEQNIDIIALHTKSKRLIAARNQTVAWVKPMLMKMKVDTLQHITDLVVPILIPCKNLSNCDSQVFKTMMKNSWKEHTTPCEEECTVSLSLSFPLFIIKNENQPAMQEFINYIKTGEVSLIKENIPFLFFMADKYQCESLINWCKTYANMHTERGTRSKSSGKNFFFKSGRR